MNEQYLAVAFILVPLVVQGVKFLLSMGGVDTKSEWTKAVVFALVFGVSYAASAIVAVLSGVPVGGELVTSTALEIFVVAIAVYDGVKVAGRLAKRIL